MLQKTECEPTASECSDDEYKRLAKEMELVNKITLRTKMTTAILFGAALGIYSILSIFNGIKTKQGDWVVFGLIASYGSFWQLRSFYRMRKEQTIIQ